MILKNKRSLKLFMCLILSCSLCVSAPLARYQRIETHAAIAVPIAIGAGTIALMYLAACGVSYIFQGMTKAEAEDWIDTKIIEFSEISDGNGGTNGPMPSGPSNWKMTALGALLLGASLSNYCERLKNWLVGNQADGTVQEIFAAGGSWVLTNGLTVYKIAYNSTDLNASVAASLYSIYPVYTYSDLNSIIPSGLQYVSPTMGNTQPFISVQNRGNGSEYEVKRQWNNGNSSIYVTDQKGVIFIVTNDNQLGWITTNIYNGQGQFAYSTGYNVTGFSDSTENEGQSVEQKTETVKQNLFIENNYYTQLNPDVETTTQDINGVPVPLSADDIADAVWEKISMNTAATTVYQPELLPAVDGFSEQANINTDDYDEPLPEPEPEPQPDWDSMNAGDVPAFTQSVWNYFLQNHNWSQLKQKFPFSLPYDAYLIANIFFDTSYDVMDELPQDVNNNRLVRSSTAPVYTLYIPWGYGDPYTLVLDFSLLDPWQPILRAAAGVLFTVALIVGVL